MKLCVKLLLCLFVVGMCFVIFMMVLLVEGRWLVVFVVLALTVFDSTSNSDCDSKIVYVFMLFIDVLNYKMMFKMEFEFSGGVFVLCLLREYKIGEEVFISYGVLNNDELIICYGFVDFDNVVDVYWFEGFLLFL